MSTKGLVARLVVFVGLFEGLEQEGGQAVDADPLHEPGDGHLDSDAALDAVLGGAPVETTQKPSIGCNIKWKPGNEPDYAL